jgi:two-component system response regulator ChvI
MLKIAVIEDNSSTNDEFKGYLEIIWPECQVFQYFDFESALAGIKAMDFDLIVSDIELGDGTDKYGGVKIAKALDSHRTPFLIVSGSPQPELQREIFRALDAWDYLQKPVNAADFEIQAKRAIAFRQAQVGMSSSEVPRSSNEENSELEINFSAREKIKWRGKRISLSMTRILLLQELYKKKNETVPYKALFAHIETGTNKENLRVHIAGIKEAFKDVDPDFNKIKVTSMLGYIWRD